MSNSSLRDVIRFAEDPENCFDLLISSNKDKLSGLSTRELNYLLKARETCQKAESVIKFTRQDLDKCVEDGLVDPRGVLAEVYNDFLIADSFFE